MVGKHGKTFFFYRHQKKAETFEAALRQFGWRHVRDLARVSVAFFDIDIMGRIGIINEIHAMGVKSFVYPHAAMPNVVYAWKDHKPHPRTSACFVSAPGHEEVMRLIGYPHPIHVVGWSYCEKLPFKPVDKINNVLFGPIHPNNMTHWIHEVDREANRNAFKRLFEASKEMGFTITVRYLYNLEANGLEYVDAPNVRYVEGHPDNSYNEIDHADVVVAKQTYGYISAARGKPTLMMDEHIPPKVGDSPEKFEFIKHWDKIKHLMMYPHDINATSDVPNLLRHVARDDSDIQEWKRQMIGPAFSSRKFHEVVLGYLDAPEKSSIPLGLQSAEKSQP